MGRPTFPGSGLDLESCRTRRNGLLLDACGFTVRTARGAVVPPGGSNFTAAGDPRQMGADGQSNPLRLRGVPAWRRRRRLSHKSGPTLLRKRVGPDCHGFSGLATSSGH
jgi:hypothetical protein